MYGLYVWRQAAPEYRALAEASWWYCAEQSMWRKWWRSHVEANARRGKA